MKNVSITLLVVLTIGLMIPNAFAENVPPWIKNTAGWWATDQISDLAFLQGIQYLINEEIIIIFQTETNQSSQAQDVPTWIKNTAGWWATDQISEVEFVNALEYLVTNKIIIVDNTQSCVNELSEIFGDSIAMVQTVCDSHESKKYLELVPFVGELNFNSLGFRGDEFSQTKPLNTYRIFIIGGSTTLGNSGESSVDTTIPGILQKIFDSYDSGQKIEVINAGFSGGNSDSELNLIKQKLVHYQPDLVVVYDGWNDLKADYPVERTKNNWDAICKFGKESDFDVIITLQPIAGFGSKVLTQQETVNSFTGEDHHSYQLITAKSTYDYIGRELLSLQDDCNVIDLRGIFDDISGPIYWDQGHVSDTANLILAEKFHDVVNEIIFNKKSNESKFHNVISKYNSPIITPYLLSKIGIDVDYNQIKKQDLDDKDKIDGNYFYLKNQLGGSGKILVGKDLSKTDLSKINLEEQDLSGANLSGQDLRNIDLTQTILRSTNLSFTNLSGQDLSGKDLQGTNFHGANLENADLSNISTSRPTQYITCQMVAKTDLQLEYKWVSDLASEHKCAEIVFLNEEIRTNFTDANLRGATMNFLEYEYMVYVDFSGADLTGIELSNVGFRDCKFIGAKLNNAEMSVATFFHVDFSNAELKNVQFTSTPFFQNVSFHNAKIIDGYFENPIFFKTDFSNTDLKGTMIDEPIMIGDNVRACQNHQICD